MAEGTAYGLRRPLGQILTAFSFCFLISRAMLRSCICNCFFDAIFLVTELQLLSYVSFIEWIPVVGSKCQVLSMAWLMNGPTIWPLLRLAKTVPN